MRKTLASGSKRLGISLRKVAMLGVAIFLSVVPAATASAGEKELGKADLACLKCHDKKAPEQPLSKQTDDGKTMSLHISTDAFVASMHGETSCEDCHSDLDAKTHGKEKSSIKSKRAFSLSMKDSCTECHKKKVKEFQDSVHAAMAKAGSDKAPVCADCHNPHTLLSVKVAQPMKETPCARCHEDIYKAYADDVHGKLRATKGKEAPICADCHRAHDIKAASLGDGVKNTCIGCHKEAVKEHQDWLPNTERHFEAISCPACHAPTAHRRVNLRLYDANTNKQKAEKTGVPLFKKRTDAADAAGEGLDERALWGLLKEFNEDGTGGKAVLRGRLEVRTGVEAHQMTEKSKAIKDCNTCHKDGAEAFQSVSLTIAGPDGRPLRHGVQKEVLSSLTSMESVRGFYAIGSTRIKLLDILLVLVVVGSILGPLAHMTVKWYSLRVRAKLAAEQAALAAAQAEAPATPAGSTAADSGPGSGGSAAS